MNNFATNTTTSTSHKQPLVPGFLSKPVTMVPQKVRTIFIVKALNILLANALQDGELDFLDRLTVSVDIYDAKLKFALGLKHGKLVAATWQEGDDLNLTGCLYDFMLLASRKEDSDTLFFHRRLKMEGNTELGLEIKNLLDGMEVETVRYYKQLNFALYHTTKVFEKLLR
ncbi:FIG138517: Putative lipid carrier protein [hydrothermal vent metagenome]|uniref:FIG138517: Putative lipid carrier protein n=1 Tax=hydrothermal vent metagenome TaxID=652676 RepID=A0A3B0VVS3_9ZZZZ